MIMDDDWRLRYITGLIARDNGASGMCPFRLNYGNTELEYQFRLESLDLATELSKVSIDAYRACMSVDLIRGEKKI